MDNRFDKYTDTYIENNFTAITEKWCKFLNKKGVTKVNLYSGYNYTINALVLFYLYDNMGKKVSKKDLTEFLNYMGIYPNDVQQARHLAQQSGWYIISGTRGDIEAKKLGLNSGEYVLLTLDKPYPYFKKEKREFIEHEDYWLYLLDKYKNKCATCGSEDGKPNRYYPSSITNLQQGHKNPSKPLTEGNIIPQCEKCNRPDRNYFIYDDTGRVTAIADPKFVLKSDKETQIEMLEHIIWENKDDRMFVNSIKKMLSEII
ncbi:MAG: hypothetical protein A2Y18_00895 [Clostridiales bacterium GWD2_32_19]|nr:MAG: hypothetical protein A2Y18_00895 [Clostridiales bacterium GWD2_32_19]